MVIPTSSNSFLQIAPIATLIAVSLAEDRSKTFLISSKSYFIIPAKSACPGRGIVTFLCSFLGLPTAILSSQFTQSRFLMIREIGDPSVCSCRTPEKISAKSFSICILFPLP